MSAGINNEPFFSVIIPTFNRYEMVQNAINSVLGQSFTGHECIVVDDGSTDQTPELEKIYQERVTWIRTPNHGVSAARNRGVRASSGKWIAFLDSDDLWTVDKLAHDWQYIHEYPDTFIFQCEETWIRRGARVNKHIKHLKKQGDFFRESLELCLISPSAVTMTRNLFLTYGPFDEDLPACEDYALWLPVTALEQVGYHHHQDVIKHGGHEDQLSRRFPVMDRFRVYALCRFLEQYGNRLPSSKIEMTRSVMHEKCRIILSGAQKRSNSHVIDKLEKFTGGLGSGECSSNNARFLLQTGLFS